MRHDPPSDRLPGEAPTPARPAGVRPKVHSDGNPEGAGIAEGAGPGSVKPLTSARAMAQTEAPPSPTTPDAEQANLEVDGCSWVVRVTGRAIGAGVARVPMLLLGFWPEGAVETEPEKECLVVGGTLEALSECELERALARSRPPIVRSGREIGEQGRRGRGGATPRRGR